MYWSMVLGGVFLVARSWFLVVLKVDKDTTREVTDGDMTSYDFTETREGISLNSYVGTSLCPN